MSHHLGHLLIYHFELEEARERLFVHNGHGNKRSQIFIPETSQRILMDCSFQIPQLDNNMTVVGLSTTDWGTNAQFQNYVLCYLDHKARPQFLQRGSLHWEKSELTKAPPIELWQFVINLKI
eukprot:Awhi_evm1s11930